MSKSTFRILRNTAVIMLSASVLAGCGGAAKNNASATASASSSQSSASSATAASSGSTDSSAKAVNNTEEAKNVASFTKSYYEAWFTSGTEQTARDLETTLEEATKGVDRSKVSDSDPTSAFSSMSEDQQKSVAEKTTSLNPMSDFYDTTGMSNPEISLLNIVAIGFSTGYHTTEKVTVDVNIDKITVNSDGTATVPYSALTITSGQNKNTPQDNTFNLPLVKKDGKWKVDGKKFYKMVIQAVNDSKATTTPSAK